MLQELKSNNAKVRKATSSSIGTLHVQLGPIVRALLLSQCDDSIRDQIEKTVDLHPYDPSSASAEWPKVSISTRSKSGTRRTHDQDSDGEDNAGIALEIPRMDLFSQISCDCATKMVNALVSLVVLTNAFWLIL
jgi:hypothetical protein